MLGLSAKTMQLLGLALLAVVPYLPAMLWGGFVWDDGVWIDSQSVQGGRTQQPPSPVGADKGE